MQGLAPSDIFLFENFRLDQRGVLLAPDDDGTFSPVPIGSRALDILRVLIERAGEIVSKDEIIAAVWPDTVVEDSNLPVQISALRRVLDNGRSSGSRIQTVAGRGYRFVAAVTHPAAEARSVSMNGEAERAEEDASKLVDLPASSSPTHHHHCNRYGIQRDPGRHRWYLVAVVSFETPSANGRSSCWIKQAAARRAPHVDRRIALCQSRQ